MGCWAGLDWARLGVFFLNYARCLFVGAALRMERGVNNNSLVGWLGGGAGDTLGGDGSGMWPLGCVAMPMGPREQLFAGWLAGWRAAGAMLFSRGLIPGGASYHNSFLASRVARRSTAGKCLAGFLGESPVQDAWDCSMVLLAPILRRVGSIGGQALRVFPLRCSGVRAGGLIPSTWSWCHLRPSGSGWVVALSMTDSMNNASLLAVGVWSLALMVSPLL